MLIVCPPEFVCLSVSFLSPARPLSPCLWLSLLSTSSVILAHNLKVGVSWGLPCRDSLRSHGLNQGDCFAKCGHMWNFYTNQTLWQANGHCVCFDWMAQAINPGKYIADVNRTTYYQQLHFGSLVPHKPHSNVCVRIVGAIYTWKCKWWRLYVLL